jgi:hypothetical protein
MFIQFDKLTIADMFIMFMLMATKILKGFKFLILQLPLRCLTVQAGEITRLRRQA